MKPPHLLLNVPLTRGAALLHSNAGPVRTLSFIKPIPVLAKPQHNQDQYVLKVSHGLHLMLLPVQWAKVNRASRNDAKVTVSPKYRHIFADAGQFPPILRIFGGRVTRICSPRGVAWLVFEDMPRNSRWQART